MKGYDRKALRQAMQARGVTQMGLAVYLGESHGAVSCKCRGLRDWWLWEVYGVTAYLHLSWEEVRQIFFAGCPMAPEKQGEEERIYGNDPGACDGDP